MKDHDLPEEVDGINEECIQNAGNSKTNRKRGYGKRVSAAVVCICLIVVAGIVIPKVINRDGKNAENPQGGNPVAVAEKPDGEKDSGRKEGAEEAAQGVSIPVIELEMPDVPENVAVEVDMIGLLVYQGRIYTQAGSYLGEDAQRIEYLAGKYLGTAKGNIDEWSSQDAYATEFASTIAGEVYAVNGYDERFRICVKGEVEDENRNRVLWIAFLDCLNGITLSTGQDLFDERLHITERTASVQWQSHHDWDYALGNLQNADIGEDVWNAFWDAVNECAFINTRNPDGHTGDPAGYHASVYDNPNQAHLVLTMNDGTVVQVRLFEGGYVGYEPLGWIFVKIPEDVFNPLYEACGGTH